LEASWRKRSLAAGTALVLASSEFSIIWLLLIDRRDYAAVFLAFATVVPTVCIVPYFLLVTRRAFAAVLFTGSVVFCAKLLGCVVVVLVYGWNASKHSPPYTDMPWMRPNLLVWLFLFNTAVMSICFYEAGRKRFLRDFFRGADQYQIKSNE
jgi:hypothetical protein